MEYPISNHCPTCNRVGVKLLITELDLLIQQHGLPELLDRLDCRIADQADLPVNQEESVRQEWNQLLDYLDKAKKQSLRIANLLDGKRDPWT